MKKLDLRVNIHLSPKTIEKSLALSVPSDLRVSGICLDTRVIEKNDLFVALSSARNGHDFVNQAFEKGASVALVHEAQDYNGSTLLVQDTYEAFCNIARNHRIDWAGPLVGISGSNGKTTSKQMLYAILSTHLNTLLSPGTWNNHLGVPLTLLLLKPEHQVAVLEMGMNHAGELRDLSFMAKPTIAILTGIGKAHIEHFGTLDKIADAKWELMDALPEKGVAILNIDDPYLMARSKGFSKKTIRVSTQQKADVWCTEIQSKASGGYHFLLHYGKTSCQMSTHLLGRHNLSNLMCVLGAALELGVPITNLQRGIDQIVAPEMRLEKVQLKNKVTLIEDCYNANPSSAKAAVQTVSELAGARKILVLGDMLELGVHAASSHREIGLEAASHSYSAVFSCGHYSLDTIQGALEGGIASNSLFAAKSREDLAEQLASFIKPGDLVLIKASRASKFESVTAHLSELFGKE